MIDPIAFRIGSLEIRWYGIIFALAFFVGILMATRLARKRNISKDIIYDFAIWLIPSAVIGARIGHVLGNFNYYIKSPGEIIAIWHGGVALYGGILGAVIAAIIFCKKKNIDFYDLGDIFVVPLAFGTTFGRIGNFINQELYGKLTSLPWGVYFDGVTGKRHPTQIYEAIGNLAVFLILIFLWKKNYKPGTIFWSYLVIYSFIRFFAEFLREGKIVFLGLTTMQLLTIPLFILSIYFIYSLNKLKTVS
ncbi:prolipoprotein diacylglyceryl transferase [Candidatus Woesearchaeota archaeon]|nr:prolipoprotein diacylglyceryl transferase [Candidatus Woesearchaeota archaeon]